MLLACFCRDANGQLTNSKAEIRKEPQSLPASNGAQSIAIEILQASVVSNPTNVERLLDLGFAYYEKGDFKAAVAAFEKVALIEPTNYQANLYLGYSHYYLNQFNAAAVAFQVATKCLSATAEAHYWLGATLYCLHRYDESVTVLRRTLVMDPNQPDAWFVLGCCQYYQKAYQIAAESFHQAALKEPTN